MNKILSKDHFGGRTDAVCLYKNYTDEDIAIGKYAKYQDIQSLYHIVYFHDWIPTGIPYWMYNDNSTDAKMMCQNKFGFIECDVTPPNELLYQCRLRLKRKLIFDFHKQ